MRWERPVYDDERIIKRFLFFPRCIQGEVRWLEFASIKQFWSGILGWQDFRWED